jgi:2'-5' RNA ligase
MFRLFVGIMLPQDVRTSLSRLCCGLAGAKWVDTDSLHLTLRFIGEVGGDKAEDIDAALQQVDAPAFELMLTGIDCFESGGKAHTLWTGVDKQPLLSRLRDKVESALVRAGCEPERRKFKPHVTLARLRVSSSRQVADYLSERGSFRSAPFRGRRRNTSPQRRHFAVWPCGTLRSWCSRSQHSQAMRVVGLMRCVAA